MRTLEVIDGARHFFDAGPRAWPPLRNGDSIGVVEGFQGSDMVTPELQIFDEESTAAEGTERCMRVTYVGATQDFERDLIFVRRGSRWVYPTPVSDPIENSGPVTLSITIQDAELTASTVLMLDAR